MTNYAGTGRKSHQVNTHLTYNKNKNSEQYYFPGDWAPKDNIHIEEGSMSKYKTEYARRFKKFDFLPASSEDLTDTNDVSLLIFK